MAEEQSVAHLIERILAEKEILAAKGVPEGERKTVTALFSDIRGSTDMMQDLDPDEARAIVDPSLRLMIEAVQMHEGYVVQSQGDGIFALFGAPVANEDHALNAIRAAMSMQEGIAAYREQLTVEGKPPLEIRVGLNTGEMVLRSISRGDSQLDYNAIGHAVNLAARIQTFASPSGIAVGEETFKLAEGYFEFRSLGHKQVKGVREPVEIRELTGVGALRSRFERAERRGLVPLVGRDSELGLMNEVMRRVLAGRGQVLAVTGEPGVGKSRLFHEFKIGLAPECLLLETSSVSSAKPFPYVPLKQMLSKYFGLEPEDLDQVRLEKVRNRIVSVESSLAEDLPFFCSLLGISGAEDQRLRQSAPEVIQRLLFAAVERLLVHESAQAPLVVVFEDIHWIDSKTEEFLVAFAAGLTDRRILLLINYRPEYRPMWSVSDDLTEIKLKPLTSAATSNLLNSMLGDGPSTASVKSFIASLSEGNPLFAEEIVRDLFERGVLRHDEDSVQAAPELANKLNTLKVPTTLQGVLASRIDALAPSYKELLQRLSVFGREFSMNLIRPFADRNDLELERALQQLRVSDFMYPTGSLDSLAYRFKHSLTQQVAYNSMTIERRRAMHERAGKAIEEVFASRLQDHYSELAYHYGHSSNLDKAVDYIASAGNQAVKIGAHQQAIGQFQEGLSCLRSLSSGPHRDAKELNLSFSLAAALWQSKGPANAELRRHLNRVVELLTPQTDPFFAFGSLQASVLLSWVNAEYAEALRRCDRLMSFAVQMNSPMPRMLALFVRSSAYVLMGELTLALRDFEEATPVYEQLQSILPLGATNIAMQSLALYGPLLCILGFPDRALRICEDAMIAAGCRSTKYYLSYVTYFAGFVHLMRGEVDSARKRAQEAIAIASEFGFPTVLAGAKVLSGWTVDQAGEVDEAAIMIRRGIDEFERSTGKVWHATLNGILLDVLIRAGRTAEAATLVDESIDFANSCGEKLSLAELWRARGRMYLASEYRDTAKAEECFRRAVATAKEKGARLFELRASTNLAYLLRDCGRPDEARATLSDICPTFSEGLDTSDFKTAKKLLDELTT